MLITQILLFSPRQLGKKMKQSLSGWQKDMLSSPRHSLLPSPGHRVHPLSCLSLHSHSIHTVWWVSWCCRAGRRGRVHHPGGVSPFGKIYHDSYHVCLSVRLLEKFRTDEQIRKQLCLPKLDKSADQSWHQRSPSFLGFFFSIVNLLWFLHWSN